MSPPRPSPPLVVILERTYLVPCNCETKKDLSVGFRLDDGENVCLASASAGLLKRKITADNLAVLNNRQRGFQIRWISKTC